MDLPFYRCAPPQKTERRPSREGRRASRRHDPTTRQGEREATVRTRKGGASGVRRGGPETMLDEREPTSHLGTSKAEAMHELEALLAA